MATLINIKLHTFIKSYFQSLGGKLPLIIFFDKKIGVYWLKMELHALFLLFMYCIKNNSIRCLRILRQQEFTKVKPYCSYTCFLPFLCLYTLTITANTDFPR